VSKNNFKKAWQLRSLSLSCFSLALILQIIPVVSIGYNNVATLFRYRVNSCDVMQEVVLYGCETWSLTLREEHRLRVFENRVLKIFGPKRDEVTGKWRKLHSEELHNLYSSPDIIRQVKSRRMRWAGHVARMGEERKVYKVLVGKPEEKRPVGRPRRR
jgi:hypothetical protein